MSPELFTDGPTLAMLAGAAIFGLAMALEPAARRLAAAASSRLYARRDARRRPDPARGCEEAGAR